MRTNYQRARATLFLVFLLPVVLGAQMTKQTRGWLSVDTIHAGQAALLL